jgi:hypothetical protein
MPCYTERMESIEFAAQNIKTLKAAVAALGGSLEQTTAGIVVYMPSGDVITIKDGKATGVVTTINALRVKYSQTILQEAAAWANSEGWEVQKSSNNQIQISKGW